VNARSTLALVGVLAVVTGSLTVASAASLSLSPAALTPLSTCTITAAPGTTTDVADSSVRQVSPGTNFASSATNNVAGSPAANRRLYIRFDLAACSPGIPQTATIRLATLRMYVTATPTSCRTVDIFRVSSTWTETAITWTNQPFGTTRNNPPANAATDTYPVGSTGGCANNAIGAFISGATVTADVAAIVAGLAPNYGWMLRDDAEGGPATNTSTYSAKDLGTAAQAPQLVVTYVLVP
jgi:hypothetical protein